MKKFEEWASADEIQEGAFGDLFKRFTGKLGGATTVGKVGDFVKHFNSLNISTKKQVLTSLLQSIINDPEVSDSDVSGMINLLRNKPAQIKKLRQDAPAEQQ